MARRVRRSSVAPSDAPYYAEGELVRERTVVTESATPLLVEDNRSMVLWLLLPAIALLLVVGYFLTRDHDKATVTQPTPVASPVTSSPSAAPPVVINQPPVVVVQPPAQPAPQQSAQPASPAAASPAAASPAAS